MDPIIETAFLITEEDFINMCIEKSHYMIPKENKIILRCIGIIAVLCGAAAFLNIRDSIYQIICWLILIATGLYVLSYYDVINPAIVKKQAASFYRFHQKDIHSKTFRIYEDELEISDEDHKIKITKKFIYKIVESKNTFFIFTDMEEYSFIPKRVLSSEQAEKLRNFADDEKFVNR